MTTFGLRVAFQLDDDARVFVRFIAESQLMSVSTLSFTSSRDALDQRGAVHVVRNFA